MNEEKNLKEEVKEIDFDEIIAKYDKESAYRRIAGPIGRFIAVLAILFSLFHLYTAFAGVLPAQIQRSVHLTFALVLAYLLYPAKKNMPRNKMHWSDICLAALGAVVGLYISFNYEALIYRAGEQTTLDIIVAWAAVLLVLEATRRVVGLPRNLDPICQDF